MSEIIRQFDLYVNSNDREYFCITHNMQEFIVVDIAMKYFIHSKSKKLNITPEKKLAITNQLKKLIFDKKNIIRINTSNGRNRGYYL